MLLGLTLKLVLKLLSLEKSTFGVTCEESTLKLSDYAIAYGDVDLQVVLVAEV